jgi:hypothetical protein
VTDKPPRSIRTDAIGTHGLHTMEDGKTVRVVVTEQQLGPSSEPTLRDFSEALITVYGTDFEIHNLTFVMVSGHGRGVPAVRIESGHMDVGGRRLNRRARVEVLRQALLRVADLRSSG